MQSAKTCKIGDAAGAGADLCAARVLSEGAVCAAGHVQSCVGYSEVDRSASDPMARHAAAGRRLEVFTLVWNGMEAAVAVGAGYAAGSIALVGFGLDSVIESLSGAALLWRLSAPVHDEGRERTALRLVGLSFLALAAWVGFDAVKSLIGREAPELSVPGMVIAALSLVVMPALARAKRRVARDIDSVALAAYSRQTSLCAYLSAILLGGLALNAWPGCWWADPVAALIMVPIIASEGLRALRGEACTC